MNTITAQAGSFYDWGLRQEQPMRAGRGTPAAGDAVIFYPPGPIGPGTLADHVGIVTAVHPGGTVDLVNGDFLSATNIGVQYDPGIRLTSWASRIWHPGEQWLLVSPPAAGQPAAPRVAITGPATAVTGTSAGPRHRAGGGTLPAGGAEHRGRTGPARHRRVLPHPVRAARILGADAYQAAGEPSRVFLSGPSGLDEARDPGGPWTAQSLVRTSGWLPPVALGLTALCLAGSGLVAFWLVRRRRAPR